LFIFITLMPLAGIVTRKELMTLAQVTRKIPLLNSVARPVLTYQLKILLLTARS
jgi:hypothetical protein